MKNDPTTIDLNDSSVPDEENVESTLIEKGATLLGLCNVESDAFVGGMGQVFRVRYTGWKVNLAMKQPRKENPLQMGFLDVFNEAIFVP